MLCNIFLFQMKTVTKSLLIWIVLLFGASFVSSENEEFESGHELTLERQLRSSENDDSGSEAM